MRGARPDLETAISFLCRRVSKSDKENWKKLKRVMLWVKESIDNKIIIVADILRYVYTWIYSAYEAYGDMRIHTRGSISMVNGVFHKKVSVKMLKNLHGGGTSWCE